MWSRVYCCCAVPLYNSGIYTILAQFFIVALVSGILSFAAPHIVAVAIPSWGPWIFGIVCVVVALFQIVGFFGVYRERPSLFKTYARINTGLVIVALAVAAAFIGLSAGRHNEAMTKCEAMFSSQSSNSTSSTEVTSGTAICKYWTWIQVGIMGLLWAIVGLTQAYFLMYTSIYASEQKLDHARYETVVNEAVEEIRQSGLWDEAAGRPSQDYVRGLNASHNRQASGLRNEVMASEPSQEYLGQYDSRSYAEKDVRYEEAYREEDYAPQVGYNNEPVHGYYPDHQQYAPEHTHYGGSNDPSYKLPSPTGTQFTGNIGWDPSNQSQNYGGQYHGGYR
ncbi:hypothetical protein MNV49_000732 [Pseudohyphozyma bogoriensis]|nr:hypothetical protein MNV49_000732 [Pseudohyphozyma bogoriensis]